MDEAIDVFWFYKRSACHLLHVYIFVGTEKNASILNVVAWFLVKSRILFVLGGEKSTEKYIHIFTLSATSF